MGQTSEMTENSCRLCDESCTSMHSVFERAPEGQQILHLIKDCLHLLIYRTDPLPKYICESCYTSLLNFSSFKRICYETLETHTEKLRENIGDNISVKLFLNALEQDKFQVNDKHNSNNTQKIVIGTNYLQENNDNESELCEELQKAINDSMRKSKIQANHIEIDQSVLTNGDIESQDEDSHASSPIKDFHGAESPFSVSQNAETQSDMELCESDNEYTPKIITANITGKRVFSEMNGQGPVVKKRRFVGPKSRIKELKENYLRLVHEYEPGIKKISIKYNPLSLMGCVLNHINKTQIPNYVCENYTKIEVYDIIKAPIIMNGDDIDLHEENICNYCQRLFMNTNSLAIHESNHMYVVLGQKVDEPRLWTEKGEDVTIRNLWYNSNNEESDNEPYSANVVSKAKELTNFDDSSGRVNVIDPEDVDFKEKDEEEEVEDDEAEATNDHQALLIAKDFPVKGEVVLIDTKATVNGVLLSEIPKDDRRTLYKSVTVNGVKRKFCPLCRYTFKDNWAIESHYFSNACHYTCRFCGVRFNKQRHEFDTHIKHHILTGDLHTTKVFASRKFNTIPKVIDETKMKARIASTPRLSHNNLIKMKPFNMKEFLVKNTSQIKLEPRSECSSPIPTKESIKTEGKPQNQAYFCRKCYQVFFKLDEFNVHVVTCRGTGFANTKIAPSIRQYNSTPVMVKKEPEKMSPEKISSSGRPVRNCVKEIGTYADDHQEEVEVPVQFRKLTPVTPVKSPRGYECGLCSSCFPTVHSRNSHMRIHKAQLHALSNKSISITKNKPENIAKKIIKIESKGIVTNYSNFVSDIQIKQEPMEPIVEIHEQSSPNNYPTNIGAVSITLLPNASQKTTLDPSIIKLVQNNPNLTIKSMAESNIKIKTSPLSASINNTASNQTLDGEKSYRCLSCSKAFANKSNLYFHKKNQCSGSKYPCPFCKKRFGTEAAYSSHIFYNHPE